MTDIVTDPAPPGAAEIGRPGITAASRLIAPHIRHTPILHIQPADFGITAGALALKLEFMQYTGSFKVRGAFANLLLRQIPAAGVVAASGGNHGIAVAFAARRLGVPAHIFVPGVAAAAKIRLHPRSRRRARHRRRPLRRRAGGQRALRR